MRWACVGISLMLLAAVYGQPGVVQQARISPLPGDDTNPIAPGDPAVSNFDPSVTDPSTTNGGSVISPITDEARPMPSTVGESPMPADPAVATSPGAGGMDISQDDMSTMGQDDMSTIGSSPALGGSPAPGALPGSMGADEAIDSSAGTTSGNTSRSSTGFSCYVLAGRQASGQNGVTPRPANFTSGVTYCYRAQRPNGTCIDATCSNTELVWNYGVTDKQGCNSMKESEKQGIYRNVFCCPTEQCNAPDPALDPNTIVIENPNMSNNMDMGIGMNDTVVASSGEADVANTTSASTRGASTGASSSAFDISPSPSTSSNRTLNTTRSSAEAADISSAMFTAVAFGLTAFLFAP